VTSRSLAIWTAIPVAVAAAFAGYRYFMGTDTVALEPDDPAVTAIGAEVYQAHCAACHGTRLEGQPNWRERGPDGLLPAPPHDETGHTWHHPDDILFRIMKNGIASVVKMKDYKSVMPVYEGVLTDEEIVAVLSWIKAQWPPHLREWQEQVNRQHLESNYGGVD
jgi:mono/diheme cytochrome c family protein